MRVNQREKKKRGRPAGHPLSCAALPRLVVLIGIPVITRRKHRDRQVLVKRYRGLGDVGSEVMLPDGDYRPQCPGGRIARKVVCVPRLSLGSLVPLRGHHTTRCCLHFRTSRAWVKNILILNDIIHLFSLLVNNQKRLCRAKGNTKKNNLRLNGGFSYRLSHNWWCFSWGNWLYRKFSWIFQRSIGEGGKRSLLHRERSFWNYFPWYLYWGW